MKNCGFCTKDSNILDKHIKSGVIKKYDSSESPNNATGFPYFEYNGNTFKGCPLSTHQLFNELKYSNGYCETENYKENFTFLPKCDEKKKCMLIVSSLASVIILLFIILLFIHIFKHNVVIEQVIKIFLLFLFIVTLFFIFSSQKT
jgi:hypothetical protein